LALRSRIVLACAEGGSNAMAHRLGVDRQVLADLFDVSPRTTGSALLEVRRYWINTATCQRR
jgi:hypothetical protein